MEIEDDNTQFEETHSFKKGSQQDLASKQFELVELAPLKSSSTTLNHEDNDKECRKNLKKKQLFKRRVNNKLMKYNDQNNQIVSGRVVNVIPTITLTPPIGDIFAFGEVILESDFFNDPYDLDKAYSWAYFKRSSTVSYLKDIKFLEVEMRRRVNTSTNYDVMIQRYLNTPHQQIHQLGELLVEYQNFSNKIVQLLQQHKQLYEEAELYNTIRQLADKYYKDCLEWTKLQTDENSIVMYLYNEFDLNSLDNDYKYIGYNLNLLKLIGLDEETAKNLILRKGRLEYVDGFSRLMIRLINTSRNSVGGGKSYQLDHNLVTLEGITIPAKCEIILPEFKCINRQNFKNYYDVFGDLLLMNYAGFRIFKYHINPNIIKQLQSVRQQQESSSSQIIDMEYSLLRQNKQYKFSLLKLFFINNKSEVFIDRFYQKQINSEVKDNTEEGDQQKTCKYRLI